MMDAVFDRHSKIALQFSGGRDALATLYLLRPYWNRLTVYWCNPGMAYPETIDLANYISRIVPNFATIGGRQQETISQFGLPSDIVTASHTPMGRASGESHGPLIQDKHSCCLRSKMLPMHERMISDGITLVIRGQKEADVPKAPIRSGYIEDGIEYLFPIEDWTSKQVMDYLHEQSAPIPRFYETMSTMPECMNCSAYWGTGAAAYLRRHHGAAYVEVQRRLDIIKYAVGSSIEAFNIEINE